MKGKERTAAIVRLSAMAAMDSDSASETDDGSNEVDDFDWLIADIGKERVVRWATGVELWQSGFTMVVGFQLQGFHLETAATV